MIKRTTWKFTLPITADVSSAEYATLVDAFNQLEPNGSVYGEAIKSDTYEITVEHVDAQ